MNKNKIKEMVATLDNLKAVNKYEKQYIEDIKTLVETVQVYYDTIDKLTGEIQKSIDKSTKDKIEISNNYDYVNALCAVLDAADGCFNLFE